MDLKSVIQELLEFREDRGWGKHHTEAELTRALIIEAAELDELFLWGRNPNTGRLAEEIADVLIYSLYLCEKRGLDPISIVKDKIVKNSIKYPIP